MNIIPHVEQWADCASALQKARKHAVRLSADLPDGEARQRAAVVERAIQGAYELHDMLLDAIEDMNGPQAHIQKSHE